MFKNSLWNNHTVHLHSRDRIKLLLLGFGPFPGIRTNHTSRIVKYINTHQDEIGLQIHSNVLPVSFEKCKTEVEKRIMDYKPHAVILVGIKFSSASINLEKVALNIISGGPDIDEVIVQNELIVPKAREAYFSTLNLHHFEDCLTNAGIPSVVSYHAGTYICNQAYYLSCYFLDKLNSNPRALLIHIPCLPSQLSPESKKYGIAYSTSREAVRLCLETLKKELAREQAF